MDDIYKPKKLSLIRLIMKILLCISYFLKKNNSITSAKQYDAKAILSPETKHTNSAVPKYIDSKIIWYLNGFLIIKYIKPKSVNFDIYEPGISSSLKGPVNLPYHSDLKPNKSFPKPSFDV